MSLRRTSFAAVSLFLSAPVLYVACGGGEDRKFVDTDASAGAGGTGATAGSGGATGGAVGTGTGGATGGAAGVGATGGGGTGGGGVDGGTPCTSPTECDDGEECNGVETCTGGFCQPGTNKKEGDPCTGADGGTGFVCSGGQCSKKCANDSECDDNDQCTGKEICNPSTGTCLGGTPLACDDSNPCTSNECNPEKGCYYPIIDNDGDGQAATSLGSCGKDCDDNDKTVFEGAAELCDGKDNNCNGQKDELAPTWYVDCDADGFAPAGAASVQQCAKPSTAHPSCSGISAATWVAQAPSSGTTDCWDKDPDAHPYTVANEANAWQDHPISGAPTTVDYDYNCDGKEEQRYTVSGIDPNNSLCTSWFQNPKLCLGSSGWISSTVPACGVSSSYSTCAYSTKAAKCLRTTTTVKQQCR